MALTAEQQQQAEDFFINSSFATRGAVITDLDGTAVHELNGRTIIHKSVETGLKKMQDLGRPILINTLRFPLSVIRTFGIDWYKMSGARIPVILLNGSQLGYIEHTKDEGFIFNQLAAITLETKEIEDVIDGVKLLLADGIREMVLFYYSEDWTRGEIIWTPDENRISIIQQKYLSASLVISGSVEKLAETLLAHPLCMVFLLVEKDSDVLMAYQHSQQSNFITHKGTDKLSGSELMAKALDFDLSGSIGAGDTRMDTFLGGVGMSVHIGNSNLPFQGSAHTVKFPGFTEFGDFLYFFASMQKAAIK